MRRALEIPPALPLLRGKVLRSQTMERRRSGRMLLARSTSAAEPTLPSEGSSRPEVSSVLPSPCLPATVATPRKSNRRRRTALLPRHMARLNRLPRASAVTRHQMLTIPPLELLRLLVALPVLHRACQACSLVPANPRPGKLQRHRHGRDL